MKDCCDALEILFRLSGITLSLQTDLNVKNLRVVLGKSWLPDYSALNRNLSVSLHVHFLFDFILSFKAVAGIESERKALLKNWNDSLCISPLWDSEVRDEVKRTKMSEHELNIKRSERVVPKTPLELGKLYSIDDMMSRNIKTQ